MRLTGTVPTIPGRNAVRRHRLRRTQQNPMHL
jgi:hypothetical protein